MNSLCSISGHGFRGKGIVYSLPSSMSSFTYSGNYYNNFIVTWTGGVTTDTGSAAVLTFSINGNFFTPSSVGVGTATITNIDPVFSGWNNARYVNGLQIWATNSVGTVNINSNQMIFRFGLYLNFELGVNGDGRVYDSTNTWGVNLNNGASLSGFSHSGSYSLYCGGGTQWASARYAFSTNSFQVLNSGFSIGGWVYATSVTDYCAFFGISANSGQYLWVGTAGGAVWFSYRGATATYGSMPLNTWVHICWTYDGASTHNFYINNSNVGSQGWGNTGYGANYQLDFGRNIYDNIYCVCYIDEFAIYNRPLTSGEVSTLYSGSFPAI